MRRPPSGSPARAHVGYADRGARRRASAADHIEAERDRLASERRDQPDRRWTCRNGSELWSVDGRGRTWHQDPRRWVQGRVARSGRAGLLDVECQRESSDHVTFTAFE